MEFDIFDEEEEKVLFELTKEDGGINLIAIDERGNGQKVLTITKEGELDLAVIKYDCLGLKLNLEKKIKRKTEDWMRKLAQPVFKDIPKGGFIPCEREPLYGGYNAVNDIETVIPLKRNDSGDLEIKVVEKIKKVMSDRKEKSVVGECGGPEIVIPMKRKQHSEKGIQGIIVTDQQKELKRMYPHILNGKI